MLADVVQRADVRVVQRGDGLRFTLEPGQVGRVGREGRRQHLERDDAIETGVAGAIHLAHAPAPRRCSMAYGPSRVPALMCTCRASSAIPSTCPAVTYASVRTRHVRGTLSAARGSPA